MGAAISKGPCISIGTSPFLKAPPIFPSWSLILYVDMAEYFAYDGAHMRSFQRGHKRDLVLPNYVYYKLPFLDDIAADGLIHKAYRNTWVFVSRGRC